MSSKGRTGDAYDFFEADHPTIKKPDLQTKLTGPTTVASGDSGTADTLLNTPGTSSGTNREQRDELMKNVVASTTERPLGIYNEYNWSYNFWGHVYENALFKPHVSERDTVILCLPGYLIVEIGLDYSFMVTSYTSNTVISVDASGSSAAFLHKNGRISQYEKNAKFEPYNRENSRVEGIIVDPKGNEKYFKMWHRGISFSSKHCPLCYLVDQGGVRTTTDVFSDLNYFNSAVYVLFHEQKRGQSARTACFEMVKKFTNSERQDYREWKCGPLRVCLLGDTSEVRLIRDDGGPSSNPNRIEVRVCPNTGKAALSTSKVRITASDDHMFVRRGTKNQSRYHSCQMHSDIHNKFEVRASGHAAGFNEDGKFTIY